MARKVTVEILGDSKSLEKAFARSSASAKKFNVGLGTIAKGAAVFGGLSAAASLAGKAIGTAVGEWQESVKVATQTNAVLKSTGAAAKVSAKEVSALASSISSLSGIDDEVIQSGENLLLTFTNIRNGVGKGNDVFTQATKVITDMSVALGQDMKSSALQVGKALNDPIKGVTALQRVGVSFTTQQKAQIKALTESGRSLEAQKLILRELNKEFGGSANAFGRTLPGALARLKQSLNNALGGIAGSVAPVIARELQGVTRSIEAFVGNSRNQERIQRAVTQATEAAVGVVKSLKGAIDSLLGVLRPTVGALGGLQNAARLLLAAFVASKVTGYTTSLLKLGDAAVTSAGRVKLLRTALLRLGAIGVITIGVEVLLNKDAIDKKVNAFLQAHHAGFLTAQAKKIPIGVDVTDLDKARQALINMGQAGDLGERSLKKVADRLREVGTEASQAGAAASKIEEFRSELPKASSGASSGATIADAISNSVTSAQKALLKALAKAKSAAAAQAKATKAAAAAAAKAADERDKAFASLSDKLSLKFDRAEAKNNFAQQLSVLRDEEKAVRAQIAAVGKTTDLERQLFQIEQSRKDIRQRRAQLAQESAQKALARAQVKQFRTLGLSDTGGEKVPGVENLRKQFAQLTDRLADSPGDVSSKLTNRLAGARRLLSKSFKGLTEDSRSAIAALFSAIRGEFSNQDKKGPLTVTSGLNTKRFLAGLELPPDQVRELRGRLAGLNSAGRQIAGGNAPATGSFVVESHTTLNIDGKHVTSVVTRGQQKRTRRNPLQRRGPNRNI